jgi:hypothetical protein
MLKRILLLGFLAFVAGTANASTLYFVSSADGDPAVAMFSGGHSLWIPGISTDLDFDPGATLEVDNNFWQLSGIVRDGGIAFEVDFLYTGIISDFADAIDDGDFTPKLELILAAYVPPFGTSGPIDPGSWTFADTLVGTLTALPGSAYAGAVLGASMIGPKAQFGVGANGKNLNLGLSNWQAISLSVQVNSSLNPLNQNYTGDVNIDAMAPVPEPSAALLFAVGGLAVGSSIRNRRR